MKSIFPVLTLLENARDSLARIVAASGATRAFRWCLIHCHRLGSRILPALVLCAALVGPLDTAGAPVVLTVQNPSDRAGDVSPDTLRGAILHAHKNIPGSEEIIIKLPPDGNIKIERPTVFNGQTTEGTSIDAYHGDFDITRSLTIDGQGRTIDAQRLGRIFDIRGQIRVTIRNVTLLNGGDWETAVAGRLDGGGAVRISNGASVMFENVVFKNNMITGPGDPNSERRGGAIYVADASGTWVSLTDCYFEWNGVESSGSSQGVAGGAIYQTDGLLTGTRTQFNRCYAGQRQREVHESGTAGGESRPRRR